MDSQKVVVLITVPSVEAGREIARALLEQKLAACVNILPQIRSLYTWQGQIHDDEEVMLLVKTRLELLEARLIPAVKMIHPYETPEIIALPIQAGSTDYLDWIEAVTR